MSRSFRPVLGLAVLAALLPFELKRPIFQLGPLAITNLELVLYAVLALWGVSRAFNRRAVPLRWTAMHTAVAAWAGVLVLSALFAPVERGAALKFALRSLGGCALFFAAADVCRSSRPAALVMTAALAGGGLAALAGIAEVWVPSADLYLLAFKTQTTLVGSYIRAGGPFQYANIAAMYWEALLPLAVGLAGWLAARRAAPAWRWLIAAAGIIVSLALVLSSSRAGLLVAAVVLVGLALLGLRRLPLLRWPALASLASLVTVAALGLATTSWLVLRLGSETTTEWYRAHYSFAPAALDLEAGHAAQIEVTLRNDGVLTWPAGGSRAVLLSYHWRDLAQDKIVIFDGRRTPLPFDVPPGTQVTLPAWVLAPAQPGRYALQWDMVQEGVLWFSAHGSATGDMPVEVRPAQSAASPNPPPGAPAELNVEVQRSRFELWRAGLAMWRERPLLGVGPDNFRLVYGAYLDAATFDNRIHANSLYVETLATLGLAGGLALVGLVAALGWLALRNVRALDGAGQALAAGLLAGLAAFFLHGVVDYFLEFTPTYGLFWLLAGLATGLLANAKWETREPITPA